jgi:cell division protein ZapA
MARVDVSIHGRSYPVLCEEGQQDRVRELAKLVDLQVRGIADGIGAPVPESQLLVLACLTIADQMDRGVAPPALEQPSIGADIVVALETLAVRLEAVADFVERP